MSEIVKQTVAANSRGTGRRTARDNPPAAGGWVSSVFRGPVEWLKNTLTFHPDTALKTSPAEHGLLYEEVWFGGADGRTLHGWYIPGRSRPEPESEWLFLWFHGNAGHIGHRLKHLRLLHEHVGGSHFLFDYQGFGRSHGKPTLSGIMQDARDVLDLVRARGWAEGRQIVYFGESLGCAVVLTVALEERPARVILSAPFYSLQAMGKIRVPPLAFLVADDLHNARLIPQLATPLLVMHGTDDRTVPFQQGYELFTLAAHPKIFLRIEGGGHTNLHEVGGEHYVHTIREFLTRLAPS
jgi:fermentation-respiration switch protein FrsA (DUF1100 family)